ncbi:MAG TPA: phosphate/phosphite/phosphonate ABC transporter substrate-binding protein [Xanthomonadales bacterium]|nr:phosphate/phosphite/phosphonate ABC transporter substrate-binding protein [Xanthomonadales bacterium]
MTSLPRFNLRAMLRVALAVALALAGGGAALAAGPPVDDELVLGRVTDNPKADYQKLKALLDYVVPRMTGVGIRRGRVLMARDNQQMISYLRRGKVDWVTETAGSSMAYQDRADAQLLLSSERDGRHDYQTVFFARRDSGIKRLEDLRGRSLALQNTASTSAYFLPASELLDAGVPLVILAGPNDRPSADVAGFVLARSEYNMSAWVGKGLVDAGAFNDQDWRRLEESGSALGKELVVFHRTRHVPRALELVRAGLDPAVRERLAEVLLAAPNDPDAQEPLQRYWRTTGFARLDAAMLASLDRLRAGVSRIHAEVE